MRKKNIPKVKRILLWILTILAGILLIAGIAVYFYWNNLIKSTIEDLVTRETKGLYKAEIGSIYYGVFAGNLYVRNFSLRPDTANFRAMDPDSAPALLIGLKVKELTMHDLSLRDALLDRRIVVKQIHVKAPDLTLWRYKIHSPDIAEEGSDTSQSIPLPAGWNSISVGEITLQAGSLTYSDQTTDTVQEYVAPYIDIRIDNLLIDSAWRTDPRIYNTDDVVITLRNLRQHTPDSMYSIEAEEVSASTAKSMIHVEGVHLLPLYSKHDFSQKLGYQTDRMDIAVKTITLGGIDWKALMLEKRLIATKLRIDSLVLDDYRDKRVPMRPGFKPPMPQQLVREIKPYFRIDSIEIVGGKAIYSEQIAEEPGTIFFDRINALMTGFTNDSAWLADKQVTPLKAEVYLQGTGRLQATINFIFGDPRNRFTVTALLSAFDLTQINPMLTKLVPAEISSGRVQQLVIPTIWFDDDVSQGKLTFYYNDLAFNVFNEKHTTWSGIKTGVINFVASDFLVPKSNPRSNGKLNSGIVFFQRDKHKSIINFIWKSIFSGLKSNMGFNTKAQKAIKKEKKESVQGKRSNFSPTQ